MEHARAACGDDLGALARLASALRAELGPERGGELWQLLEARPEPPGPSLAAALADPAQRVVAGCIDDVVVGYGIAALRPLPDGSTLARVLDLYVEPGARGVGVGEAMMADLLSWAAGRGCRGIDAVALPGLREAKNLFERFGLVARSLVVHRALGPAPVGERPA